MKKIILGFFIILLFCSYGLRKKEYGVFIGVGPEKINTLLSYKIVIIDAEFYAKEDIEKFHKNNVKVYSYLNIGSIESFREYYPKYTELILSEYENWSDEYWVDVSNKKWQSHIAERATLLIEKGVDGFFLDNTDIYYHYPNEKILQGLKNIINNLNIYKKDLIINGGDTFISKAILSSQKPVKIKGINQECVFTNIDFENNKLILQNEKTKKYYQDYLKLCKAKGLEVYLTEYATDNLIEKDISKFCKENQYQYFISNSINLDSELK